MLNGRLEDVLEAVLGQEPLVVRVEVNLPEGGWDGLADGHVREMAGALEDERQGRAKLLGAGSKLRS